MGDQIGGMVWCSSGIIFGSFCDGGLRLVQVEYVAFAPMLAHLEEGSYHHHVLQF